MNNKKYTGNQLVKQEDIFIVDEVDVVRLARAAKWLGGTPVVEL